MLEVLETENLFGIPKEQVGLQNQKNVIDETVKSKMRTEDEKDEVDFLDIIIYVKSVLIILSSVSNNRL